ncbi:MAG: hypothetical protein QM765_14355 [Myxococcales bacterium]
MRTLPVAAMVLALAACAHTGPELVQERQFRLVQSEPAEGKSQGWLKELPELSVETGSPFRVNLNYSEPREPCSTCGMGDFVIPGWEPRDDR